MCLGASIIPEGVPREVAVSGCVVDPEPTDPLPGDILSAGLVQSVCTSACSHGADEVDEVGDGKAYDTSHVQHLTPEQVTMIVAAFKSNEEGGVGRIALPKLEGVMYAADSLPTAKDLELLWLALVGGSSDDADVESHCVTAPPAEAIYGSLTW